MKFPIVLPRCTPFSKISAVSTIHLVPGKDKCFCSPSTSSLPPRITENRRWQLIASFPSPAQETLIYFLLCVENGRWIGWCRTNPCEVPSLLQHREEEALCQTPAVAQSRHLCDHLKPQLLDWVVILMFWCNISVAHLSWSVSSDGISCIYQHHAHRRSQSPSCL